MTEQACLFDSSIWIRSIRRSRRPTDLKVAVDGAIDAGVVATCAAVRMELLVGARDEREFASLAYSMRGLTEIPITAAIWEGASRLGYDLRHRGFQIGVADLLIAQCAIITERVLWHTDAHFEQIRQHSGLQTRYWEIST